MLQKPTSTSASVYETIEVNYQKRSPSTSFKNTVYNTEKKANSTPILNSTLSSHVLVNLAPANDNQG
jgi:hypothetical protein